MTSKTPYIMFRYPDQEYAMKYCKKYGLILGETYLIENPDNLLTNDNYVYIVTDYGKAEVGIRFFEQHFKIDLRTINLDKLLDDSRNS